MRVAGLVVVALVLGCSTAGAQTGGVFNRTGSGARAAGMANAFIAVSDDGTAVSWNPAGLGQLRKPELSVVTTTAGRSLGAEGFRTRDDLSAYSAVHTSYSSSYLDFASLAVPVTIAGKPVTFQAGWRRLYTLDYRENVSLRREPLVPAGPPAAVLDANSDVEGGVDLLSFAGAVKLTPRLALGASVNLWRGDWTEAGAVSETPVAGPGPPGFRMSSQSNHLDGHNLSLGLMLTYPRWSLGAVYQDRLRGDLSIAASARTSRDPQPPSSSLEARLRFPRSVGLGAAWRPAPRWTVALDLTRDAWSDTLIEPAGAPPVNLFDGLPPDLSGTRDTISANAGAECLFHGEGFVVPLRFGVAWEPQGPRNAYTRDAVNFVMLAVGTGYNTNSLKFDAALQYRWARFLDGANFSLDDSTFYPPPAVGERSAREWRVKLSLIVRVTDTDKLRRTLRKIFGG